MRFSYFYEILIFVWYSLILILFPSSVCLLTLFLGFSSPYPSSSHKTSPSLSRNNSDVSQYSLSPSMSPVPGSRYSNPASHPGYPSPAFPSSPLPRSGKEKKMGFRMKNNAKINGFTINSPWPLTLPKLIECGYDRVKKFSLNKCQLFEIDNKLLTTIRLKLKLIKFS